NGLTLASRRPMSAGCSPGPSLKNPSGGAGVAVVDVTRISKACTCPENASKLRLVGGEREIRTPETLHGFAHEILPERGALFSPKRSIRDRENLLPGIRLFLDLSGSLHSLR